MTALPTSLVAFRRELEDAVAHDLGRRMRPLRRRVLMLAAATATAVMAIAIANAVTGEGPSVVDRAAAALSPSADGVFHLKIVGHTTTTSGGSSSWTSEAWVSTSRPYAERELESGPGGTTETGVADGLMQIYDPGSNTIYEASKQAIVAARPNVKQGASSPAPPEGKKASPPAQNAAPAAEKPAGSDSSSPWDAKFRDRVLGMLRSGDAHEDGTAVVDGRNAIRIVATQGEETSTYFVDARSYDPVEWRQAGPSGDSTLHFDAYETLPPSAAASALLSLRAQHPHAAVNDDPAAYAAFVGRQAIHK